MHFRFGVDSFIWAESFGEKDLWIIEKARELGFKELAGNCAVWRSFAPTGEVPATEGLANLRAIATRL